MNGYDASRPWPGDARSGGGPRRDLREGRIRSRYSGREELSSVKCHGFTSKSV
jgi:hypothetical protein